ncbi:hypothetical protein Nepgr_023162 [Nepenthes gracilis]|uniref:Uncharacterized protein n=1 Tax=Nepenthes gracilis TaxID=150966 RepID=A0AAD3T0R5_NEPGR|nr:hypothetical protein Nepgr_023162 [Nepenthes gracilis]
MTAYSEPLPGSVKIVDVEIVYHSKPAHRISQHLNSQNRVSRSLQQQPNFPQAPAHEPGSHVGLVVHPPDLMFDAEALKESSSAHVIPSFSGMGRVLCSDAADSDSEPTEAEVGLKGSQVEDGGASHCPVNDGDNSYCALVDPGGAHQNLDYPSYDLDQLESNVPPVSNADSPNCGLGIPPPDVDEFPIVDSIDQSSDATPFKALDQAPFFKMERFAPEILSAEALSSAPRCRMLAPCSDICHLIKFRRSNLVNLAPEGGPVDDGPKLASSPFAPPREALGVVPLDDPLSSIDILPNPGADIENHDLSIPPSDGMTSKMEPTSVINPDLTPSPISRILKKYSLHTKGTEQSDCEFTDIPFHYQWKLNQNKLPPKKGPDVLRKNPSGIYIPKGKLRDNPKPNPSSSKFEKKGPGTGDLSSSVPKPTPPPISNSFGALQDFGNDGPLVDKEMRRDSWRSFKKFD